MRRDRRPIRREPQFTYHEIVDPSDPPWCPHGHSAMRATVEGWPVCAICRRRIQAIKNARTTTSRGPGFDYEARAANDTLDLGDQT